MKTLRALVALFFAAALTGSALLAAEKAPAVKPAESKEAKADCGCATGKDGKVCGIDKDCCCSGEKAKGRSDKKPEDKKSEEKKTAKHGDKDAGCDGSCGA